MCLPFGVFKFKSNAAAASIAAPANVTEQS